VAFVAAAVAFALLSLGVGVSVSRRPSATSVSEGFAALPASPASALEIGPPEQLHPSRFLSRWTIVRARAPARTSPSPRARAIAEV
jgi:hypothetical protein